MNKKDLITAISEETGMTKKDVTTVVDVAFDKITAAMVAGDKVQLMGFGTFETRERGERTGKNPRTGEEVKIDACKVPAFKASKLFIEKANKK